MQIMTVNAGEIIHIGDDIWVSVTEVDGEMQITVQAPMGIVTEDVENEKQFASTWFVLNTPLSFIKGFVFLKQLGPREDLCGPDCIFQGSFKGRVHLALVF